MTASRENRLDSTESRDREPRSVSLPPLEETVSRAADPRPAALAPDDPDIFDLVNPSGRADVLLLADHAGNTIPGSMSSLGLSTDTLERHIAFDPGVDSVTRRLAALLDAPAVIHRYSRLLIDPNRPLDDPTSICQISDETIVPGNRNLAPADRKARADTFFWPYHRAVAAAIESMTGAGRIPAVISVHSFSPVVRDRHRPWEIGVLWNDDSRLPGPFMEKMRAEGLCVGDNEPYSGRNLHGYTMETHVLPVGFPNILLELRQDLVADADSQEVWARRLAGALGPILVDLRKIDRAHGWGQNESGRFGIHDRDGGRVSPGRP